MVLVLLVLCSAAQMCGEEFYVSPKGADTNPGTKSQPFASLERARDAARAAKHDAPITIWLRGGDYRRTAAFALIPEDSGTAAAPMVYRAVPGERVRIVGGVPVKNFKKWRGEILRADLRAQGITNYGEIVSRGKGRANVAGLELFFNGQPMTLARWPNVGWAYTGAATRDKAQSQFAYEGERAARWRIALDKAPDAWLHGYWYYDWADHYERITSIDTAHHVIDTAAPNPAYGYRAGQRWQLVNMLDELDEPGEWYLDRAAGMLYFWPPSPIASGVAEVSLLDKPLVSVEGASYVEFRDLAFEVTRADGIVMDGGSHDRIEHCSIANTGNAGVVIRGGAGDAVEDSEVRGTGDGGIVLDGGDRKTLTAAAHIAARNHIHDYARWSRTYTPAISVSGVGNRVTGNTIDHAPHFAIWVHGNDHLIEGNDVHTVSMETGDVGAYYIGADTTERGNTVRGNYFHNLGLGDVNAVYLDDESSGSFVIGNVIRGAARGVKIGGGNDNVLEKNKFVDDDIGIHFDARGMGWQKAYFDGTNPALLNRLKAMPYKEEPWRSRYPQLPGFLDQTPGLPTGNAIHDNDCWCRIWVDYRDKLTEKNLDSVGNQAHPEKAVWNPEWVKGMGLDIDTSLLARRLTAVSPTQAKLTIENQGRSAQSGVFAVWIEPGVDARIVTPPEIPFSLKPGEKAERTITIEHASPVYLGVYLKGESFVPAGIKMK
ncbi:right-handed parallel beta-helix repeat-containing protein [Terriglobus sp. 2YAB30_2]|uniref:right-handed parallel beta-helix repeat-containing protein n=1 Tax=Terriglobus sp. 2YAB30_2 TaxID=3233023 RepID=UPI003F99BA98